MGSETLRLSQKPGNTGKRSCTVDDLSFGPAPVCRRPEADCGEVEGGGRKEWKECRSCLNWNLTIVISN